MTTSKEKMNCLFEVFAGEYVNVITEFSVERTSQTQKEVSIIKAPLSVSGYLTDEDDFYYYLGENPTKYNQAVNKNNVVIIELSEEKSDEDQRLKEIEGPERETGYN